MKFWKKWDNEGCPQCGEPEDSEHILLCQGANANDTWDEALHSLQQWLDEQQTNPDIALSIISSLHNWRYSDTKPLSQFSSINLTLDMQSDIGWNLLLEGWATFAWADQQAAYYKLINSRKSGRRWLIALTCKLWLIAWDLWEHRNGILHETKNHQLSTEMVALDRQVRKLYSEGLLLLSHYLDCYLFLMPLEDLLRKQFSYKQA
jgi:hypothetical protein